MSELEAFLHPVKENLTKDIIISKRFLGKDGKPAAFTIRAIPAEEDRAVRKACTKKIRDRSGTIIQDFDTSAYTTKIVIAGTMKPDFQSKEMCEAYGTEDPMQVPGKMLLIGEFDKLADEIAKLSGLDDDVDEEAKN